MSFLFEHFLSHPAFNISYSHLEREAKGSTKQKIVFLYSIVAIVISKLELFHCAFGKMVSCG